MDMIKHLLVSRYPQEKGYSPSVEIIYPEVIYANNFFLSDKHSCVPSKKKGLAKCVECSEDVLYINTAKPIHELDFDAYTRQFDDTIAEFKGDRCDYLLYDENENMARPQIVFCELTCMESKYVEPNTGHNPEGKRAKAYKQIKNSIENLLSIFLLNTAILTYPSKIGLFGWREVSDDSVDDEVTRNIESFSATPAEESPILYNTTFVIGHNFTFIQIKYPTHFEWDKNYI